MSPTPSDSLRELVIYVLERELGKPYVWGGDDPLVGWDCSGLMVEGLKATGRLPGKGDWTAATLSTSFPETTRLQRGVLVFWNRGVPARIGHVEMIWGLVAGVAFTIGAAGGGSGTRTRDEAIAADAYVRIRPLTGGWVKAVDPYEGG